VLAEVHPIDHHRHQVQRVQVGGEQLGQRGLESVRRNAATPPSATCPSRPSRYGPRPARARHRSAAWRARRASGPRHPAENLGAGEQLIRGHRQLTRAIGRPHPRPRHRYPAPAQTHRAALAPVPHRHPLGIVTALGPTLRGHVLFHDRAHHLQTGTDRKSQQPLPHLPSQLSQRHAHRVGHSSGLTRVDSLVLVSLAHGGPLPSWCSWRFTRVPTARQDSGGGPPPQLPRDPGQPLYPYLTPITPQFHRWIQDKSYHGVLLAAR
jgi:hypothetical protein